MGTCFYRLGGSKAGPLALILALLAICHFTNAAWAQTYTIVKGEPSALIEDPAKIPFKEGDTLVVTGGALQKEDWCLLADNTLPRYHLAIEGDTKQIADNALSACRSILSLTGLNVRGVGKRAFERCSSLTKVRLPEVTAISPGAFAYCSALEDVLLSRVLGVGKQAFADCKSLVNVQLPMAGEIGADAFYNCNELITAFLPEVTRIASDAFALCDKLERVFLPKVQKIEDFAFWNCEKLTSIVLPSLRAIGKSIFANCKSLRLIELGGSPSLLSASTLATITRPLVIIVPPGANADTSPHPALPEGSIIVERSPHRTIGPIFEVPDSDIYLDSGLASLGGVCDFQWSCDGNEIISELRGTNGSYLFAENRKTADSGFYCMEFTFKTSPLMGETFSLPVAPVIIGKAPTVNGQSSYKISQTGTVGTALRDRSFPAPGTTKGYSSIILSGTVPQGVIFSYDSARNGVLLSGTPTEAGEFTLYATLFNDFTRYRGDVATLEINLSLSEASESEDLSANYRTAALSLSQHTLSLRRGGKTRLVVQNLTDEAFSEKIDWISSDANVVSVDESGNLTALTSGDALITAVDKEGEQHASFLVSVLPPEIPFAIDFSALGLDDDMLLRLVAKEPVSFQLSASEKSVFSSHGLPPGLSMNQDGLISGRPQELGSWFVTIIAATEDDTTDRAEFTIEVVHPHRVVEHPLSSRIAGPDILALPFVFLVRQKRRRAFSHDGEDPATPTEEEDDPTAEHDDVNQQL